CGFDTLPSRQAIDLRFAELEQHADAFLDVARELISHARSVDTRIGVSVFVDSTAFHSASVLSPFSKVGDGLQGGGKRRVQMERANVGQVLEEHLTETEAPESSLDD